MNSEILRNRLLSILASLPERYLDVLEGMLDDPKQRRAFLRLIESALELNNGSFAPRQRQHYIQAPHHGSIATRDYYSDSDDPIRRSLSSLLWDKEIFPTTAAVIEAVDHFFGIQLNPQEFRKSGRRAVIARTWKALTELPRKERNSRLQRFFAGFEARLDPHKSYRELFKILSRSE